MDYVELLKAEIASGFSKSDLEFLIGLPKNSLSGVINQGRPLSKKSKAKIDVFLQSDKPDPKTFDKKKLLAEIKLPKEVTNQVVNDLLETGIAITETTEEGVRAIHPMSEEGFKVQELAANQKLISQYQEELTHLGKSSIAKQRRKWLENKLKELQNQTSTQS